jgi:hypothetical protein
MSVKGGVYAHEAYEGKKIKIFFCYVNTWDRHRLYIYILLARARAHTHTHTHEGTP